MKNLALFISFIFSTIFVWSVNPVPYSGKISIRGVNYDGDAQFTFSLQTKDGKTRWRNGNKKEDSIKVRVRNGFYTVLLGGQGMNALPPQLFLDYDELYLKVRFDNGDGKGLRHLEPDQRITATPRALVAEVAKSAKSADTAQSAQVAQTANSVKAGAVTSSEIAANTITTAQLNEQILKYLKPEITHTPQAPGLIFGGQTVTLHSRAEGKYLNYQWYKNGQPINGATGKRFVIQDVNKSRHDGNYSLVVSNDFGRVTTQSTQLVVDGTPTIHTVASISLDMIFCPPGTFTMGSPTTEAGRGGDETQHQVTLSHGFYLGKHEVTQAQYEAVMTGNSEGLNAKPSNWPNNNDRPVEKVSWNDVQVFLSRLNDMEETAGRLPTGWKYVLPTEAQWEYACRAGTTTAYSWGNDINSSRANYNWDGGSNDGNDFKQTRDVGKYTVNPWGFFDMHGNVWEWVSDWKANYPGGAQTNPEGPASGSNRVFRGGSWNTAGTYLRSAKRNDNTPGLRTNYIGFRVGFQAVQPDMANPELELFGGVAITREAGQAWAEPGVEAHDARDGNITDQIVVTGSVDMNSTGTYLLTYSVQDGAGNTASTTRTVTVVGNRSVDLNATVAMDMIWVPSGTFTMGSPTTEAGQSNPIVKTSIMCPSPKGFT
jgi:formylglycine-generating enzyme required for sulfatase activity